MNLDKAVEDMKESILSCKTLFEEGFNKTDKKITTKSNENDLLTEYDIKINEMLLEKLKKKYPSANIISEECGAIENKNEYTFYIDPIDGTRNFSRGIPVCHIGIGLAKEHEIVACVTYNPIQNKLYSAIKNKGTFCNGERIQVSKRELKHADIYLNGGEKTLKVLKTMHQKIPLVKFDWCSHNSFSLIASGKCEALLCMRRDHPWDLCHYLLVIEAGGKITTLEGKPFDLTSSSYLVSNAKVHNEILELIKNI